MWVTAQSWSMAAAAGSPGKVRLGSKYNHSTAVRMTRAEVIRCLRGAGGFSTPELNDKLYLHSNSFGSIGGLEDFVEAKVIWLQSNCLVQIDGLAHLRKLRVLYLHQNMISSLDGLAGLEQLHTLNVSQNALCSLRGVAHLPALSNLYAARNYLSSAESVADVENLGELTVLDLADNRIEGPESAGVCVCVCMHACIRPR